MNRVFSIVLSIILVASILTVSFNTQNVEASGTIYIRAGGSVDPPTAPISTVDYVTYNLTGNVSESIVIERDSIVFDGGGYTVQGTGASYSIGIDLTNRTNVKVKNAHVDNFWIGVDLYSSPNNLVTNNRVTANAIPIFLVYSDNNTISYNTLTNNTSGIGVDQSSNNTLIGNGIANHTYDGVYLSMSVHTTLSGNVFANCGLYTHGAYENQIEGNTVNGKPLVYLEDISDRTVENAGQVVLVNCSNVRVKDLDLSNATIGIELYRTINSVITNNSIASNSMSGVFFDESYNITMYGNNVTANHQGVLFAASNSSNLSGNNITENAYGVYLATSFDNILHRNKMVDDYFGVSLDYSSGNFVSENDIKSGNFGLYLYSCSSNAFSENNVTNGGYGIYLTGFSGGNKLFHNNFIGNLWQAFANDTTANEWDGGYPFGGNYWSDYSSVDLYRGPGQNITGSDGIGDTSYDVETNNKDRYPLMGSVGSSTKTGANITVFPVSKVCVIFEKVTEEGLTTVEKLGTGPAPPPGFTVVQYYAIETTAGYTDQISIKIICDESMRMLADATQGGDLQLMQCVMLVGDVDKDFDVDIFDLVRMAGVYGVKKPNPRYDSSCDVDADGDIDIFDLVLMAGNYGEKWQATTGWVDITTWYDPTTNSIFGVTQHLSIFGVTRS